MLAPLAAEATSLLQLQPAARPLLERVRAAATPDEIAQLLGAREWRLQLLAATAALLGSDGGGAAVCARLWQAIDGASWVAPQLIAVAFLIDDDFAGHASARLLDVARLPPKTIGALVRAYHRLPAPDLSVVARLGRHDRVLAMEEARVGVRGVDAWLDRLPTACGAAAQAGWRRKPR